MKKNIVVFASGSGSNAEKIFEYFQKDTEVAVAALLYNRKEAGVVARAEKWNIASHYFTNLDFEEGDKIVDYCQSVSADFIVLAGFLRKISNPLLQAYPNKIINIHPALLPKYGGKGMYGHFVHEKVSQEGEIESGISIHLVNEKFDDGRILAQYSCPIVPHEDADSIASKVLQLEHLYFAPTIKNYILQA